MVHSTDRGSNGLESFRGQPVSRLGVDVQSSRRKKSLRKIRDRPFIPVPKNFPVRSRNDQPPFSAPVPAARARFIDAMYRFHLVGVEALIRHKVVEARVQLFVCDGYVSFRFPHGKRGMRYVPSARQLLRRRRHEVGLRLNGAWGPNIDSHSRFT